LYSSMSSSVGNSSSLYGLYNVVSKPSGSSGIPYGLYNYVGNDGSSVGYNIYGLSTGTATTRYGVYMTGETDNYFSSNTGIGSTPGTSRLFVYTPSTDGTSPIGITATNNYTGTAAKYGIDVNVDGAGSGTKFGISSSVVGLSGDNSPLYGYQLVMNPNGTGVAYGLYSTITATSSGLRYGIYNNVYQASTNTSFNYGIYNDAWKGSGNLSGTNYGIFSRGEAGSIAYGIYATAINAGINYAGYFQGNVHVNGTLSKSAGSFKIDHPQDPENKYLVHSFVESPDMMNVYNGNTTTDANGDAVVALPGYFQAENIDFKYQLTVIGQFAQAIVYEEINNNQFKIKTDKPNVKVSWQVTGVRNDEFAKQNRIVPELEKAPSEKGKYLNPELYGKSAEQAMNPAPERKAEEVDADPNAQDSVPAPEPAVNSTQPLPEITEQPQ